MTLFSSNRLHRSFWAAAGKTKYTGFDRAIMPGLELLDAGVGAPTQSGVAPMEQDFSLAPGPPPVFAFAMFRSSCRDELCNMYRIMSGSAVTQLHDMLTAIGTGCFTRPGFWG